MTTTPSPTQKQWAEILYAKASGDASVAKYFDDQETTHIHVFSGDGPEGFLAATIGLMDIDQSKRSWIRFHTEVLAICRRRDKRACNLLSTIAFFVLKDQWRLAPGTVFETLVAMYFPQTRLPHVLFTAPFDWEAWGKVVLGERAITPLLCVPVSEAEADLVSTTGSVHQLEAIWKHAGTDLTDWDRASAV